ncbi:MAG TPA: OmpH family outer membrane protein [Bryobacteraceae bacterium]|nr:OmpH family outer membrane protein [Bryobacteraceae bacterium]
MVRTSFVRLFLMTSAVAVLSGVAAAQTKVAVINMQQAVLGTAEIKKASVDLETKYKPKQAEIEKVRKDLDDIQQKLQSGGGKMPPQTEADLTLQSQRKQRELQRMSQDLQEEVDGVRNDVLSQAGRRMQEVVQKLAEERGMDVVVDSGSTLYVKPVLDLTKDAVAAYDKAYPAK